MKFELEQYHRNTSKEELIADLLGTTKKLGKKSITISDYEQNGKFHPSTLIRQFGSWFKVLEAAGLEDSRSRLNISNEDLFRNIEMIWMALGRQPKYSEIKKPLSKYSAGTYDKRFGSWLKALDKFVEYMNLETEITDSENTNSDNLSSVTQKHKLNAEIKHQTKREISDRLRFRILMRDGFTCKKCGNSPLKSSEVELHVDHIIPWSKGGETVPENLETKCKKCNLGKGNAFQV